MMDSSAERSATWAPCLAVIGDKLDLYRAMAGTGVMTPFRLATLTGTAERYVREWLSAQAALVSRE